MKQRTCFIICPIGDEGSEIRTDADLLYDFIIKPVLSAPPFGMTVTRADKLGQPGIITNQLSMKLRVPISWWPICRSATRTYFMRWLFAT
jgi:hypothetical protein